MVDNETKVEDHIPPKLIVPEEETTVCVRIPKNYIERIDALYVLSRGDPDYEVGKFIRDAMKLSLQASISSLNVYDPELEPRVSGEDGETSQ